MEVKHTEIFLISYIRFAHAGFSVLGNIHQKENTAGWKPSSLT